VNFALRCKGCRRENTIDVVPKSYVHGPDRIGMLRNTGCNIALRIRQRSYTAEDSSQSVAIAAFDCRYGGTAQRAVNQR
jgi:hypothetical protein